MKFRILTLLILSILAGMFILAKSYLNSFETFIKRYQAEIKIESYLPLKLSHLELKSRGYRLLASNLRIRSVFPRLLITIEEMNIREQNKISSSNKAGATLETSLPLEASIEVSNLTLFAKNHQIKAQKLNFKLSDTAGLSFKAQSISLDELFSSGNINGLWNKENKSLKLKSEQGYQIDFSYRDRSYLKIKTPLSPFSEYIDQLELKGYLELDTSWQKDYPELIQARFTKLQIRHPLISQKAIKDINASIKIEKSGELWKSKISIYGSEKKDLLESLVGIIIKDNKLFLSRVILKDQSCNSFNRIFGKTLFSAIKDERLTGTLNLDFDLLYDIESKLSNFKLRKLSASCKINEDSVIFSRHAFRVKNKKIFKDLNSKPAQALASLSFQKNISPYLALLLVSSEDSGFWNHPGWEKKTLEIAIKENLKEKKIKLGASTITMQLAKNLYLTHKRNLARKLEEFILASHLESILTKDEILTIYANIIEYGPNIYGIENASQILFSKTSLSLSPMQALYLSSILPRPRYFTHLLCEHTEPKQIYSRMQTVYDRFQILRPNYIANFSFNPSALQFKISENYRSELCRNSGFYSSAREELSSKL